MPGIKEKQKNGKRGLKFKDAEMKKLLLIPLLLLTATISFSQLTFQGISSFSDCGTWEPKPIWYSEWEALDTIKQTPIRDTIRNWVYDEEKLIFEPMTYAVYTPCGSGTPLRWIQKRVCSITGIVQQRFKVQEYVYIPKPKSEFDKTIDDLKKRFK